MALDTRTRLWPVAAFAVAQAFLITWLISDVVVDHRGPLLPTSPGGHGLGHNGPSGPAPVAAEPGPHFLGLAAFTVHVMLPVLIVAIVSSQRLVARWGRDRDDLVGRLLFALAVGVAGAVVSVVTSWLAVSSSTGDTGSLPEVAVVGTVVVFRYSLLLGLIIAVLGGIRWLGADRPRQGNPAVRPVELLH
ncbi:MAG: hypothetical protein M3548_06485 [Actinomycetota bacterium]|nr:hypothetical protein [Actinomycetota bacterium]